MWLLTPDIGHYNGIPLLRSNRLWHTASTSMLIIAFVACIHVITANGQQKGDEVCETLPSEIHLIKGKVLCCVIFAFHFSQLDNHSSTFCTIQLVVLCADVLVLVLM